MRHAFSIRAAALAALLLLVAAPCRADDPCPAKSAYEELHQRMNGLRDALDKRFGSGWSISKLPAELAEQVDHLQTAERDLASQSGKLTERWEDCATQAKHLDFDHREFDAKLKFIDRAEEQLKPQDEAMARRINLLAEESSRHNMSMPSIKDEAAMARWNAEAEDGNRRLDVARKDKARLDQEHEALAKRRADLFADVAVLASHSNILMRRRAVLMQDLVPMVTQARRLAVQATALTQLPASGVSFAPAPPANTYQNYDKATAEVVGAIAQEASLQVLKRAVVASEGPGLAVAAQDVLLDASTAGIDARTREVERNLLLIGDYGKVLKRMKEGGTLKPDDPAYQAIRQVLKEQQETLPGSNAEIVLQGLGKSEAMLAGMSKIVATAAGNYLSEKVAHAGQAVVKHLNNVERATLGKGMVKFFSNCISGTAEAHTAAGTSVLFKHGSDQVSDQLYGPPEGGRHE